MKKSILTAIAISGTLITTAQITLDHTLGGSTADIITLSTSGDKILTFNNETIRLYNLDYSLWKSIDIPQFPNYTAYFWGAVPSLVSEELFDNDPSSIEILIPYIANVQDQPFKTAIIRDNGTVLTEFEGSARWDEIPSVFVGNDGKLKLPIGNSDDDKTRIYSLPGSFPCQPDFCNEGGNSGSKPVSFEKAGGILSNPIPNPANSFVTIKYSLPPATTAAFLQIMAVNGKVLSQHPINGINGSINIDISQYKSGSYLYQIKTTRGISNTKKLQVIN